MSAINEAHGGDGWSSWSIERQRGDNFHILVTSNAEQTKQPTPSGWGPKVLFDETIRDESGRRALDRALSESAQYGYRMAV